MELVVERYHKFSNIRYGKSKMQTRAKESLTYIDFEGLVEDAN